MTAASFPLAAGLAGNVEPRLAVVVPARDRRDTLPRALASVLADPRPDIEVAVIDDGSTDGTDAYLASVRDPRLRWRRVETPAGANSGRNLGVVLTRAPLIAFLDSDDVFMAGRLERLIAFFDRNPQVACTIDGFIDIQPGGARLHALPDITPDAEQLRRLLLSHSIPLTNSTLTVRRTAFKGVCGYAPDLMRHQDREFLLRLAARHRIVFGSATDVLKYRSGNSISRAHFGYIEGLDDFVARCPDYRTESYRRILGYLTVRGILKAAAQGRLDVALTELLAWRRAVNLPPGLRAMPDYFAGRRQRRRLARDINQATATTSAE